MTLSNLEKKVNLIGLPAAPRGGPLFYLTQLFYFDILEVIVFIV